MVDVHAKQTTPVTVEPAVDGRHPVYQPVALVPHLYSCGGLVAKPDAVPP